MIINPDPLLGISNNNNVNQTQLDSLNSLTPIATNVQSSQNSSLPITPSVTVDLYQPTTVNVPLYDSNGLLNTPVINSAPEVVIPQNVPSNPINNTGTNTTATNSVAQNPEPNTNNIIERNSLNDSANNVANNSSTTNIPNTNVNNNLPSSLASALPPNNNTVVAQPDTTNLIQQNNNSESNNLPTTANLPSSNNGQGANNQSGLNTNNNGVNSNVNNLNANNNTPAVSNNNETNTATTPTTTTNPVNNTNNTNLQPNNNTIVNTEPPLVNTVLTSAAINENPEIGIQNKNLANPVNPLIDNNLSVSTTTTPANITTNQPNAANNINTFNNQPNATNTTNVNTPVNRAVNNDDILMPASTLEFLQTLHINKDALKNAAPNLNTSNPSPKIAPVSPVADVNAIAELGDHTLDNSSNRDNDLPTYRQFKEYSIDDKLGVFLKLDSSIEPALQNKILDAIKSEINNYSH